MRPYSLLYHLYMTRESLFVELLIGRANPLLSLIFTADNEQTYHHF